MGSEGRWSTTVHDLMLTFRDALAALTPCMDRVKIGWRDEEAYDDWDEIAQSLYKNMVLRSILFATEPQEDFATPEYGMVYPSYEDKSFIAVVGGTSRLDAYQVFVAFSTLERPFDQVRCQWVSAPDFHATADSACMPLEQTKFVFIAKRRCGVREGLSDIVVEL